MIDASLEGDAQQAPVLDCPVTVRVQREPFDVGEESRRITAGRTDIGAVVTFAGLCRDEGATLAALELEYYPGMAEAELARIAAEAAGRWALLGLLVVHRYGVIRPGEPIVLVIAGSAHRRPAFEAAEFLMDYLKTRAPFWKKEHLAGDGVGDWVEAQSRDEAASARWR